MALIIKRTFWDIYDHVKNKNFLQRRFKLTLTLNKSRLENLDTKMWFLIFLRRQIAQSSDLSENLTRVPTCHISRFIKFFSAESEVS